MVKKASKNTATKGSSRKPRGGTQEPKLANPASNRTRCSQQEVERQLQQQRLLNVFSNIFADILSSSTFDSTLQEVKQALFNRDFDLAFGKDEYLRAYAARWSPTRALCYDSIFRAIAPHLGPLLQPGWSDGRVDITNSNSTPPPTWEPAPNPDSDSAGLRAVSIGGGAAETVAFGSFLGCSGDGTVDRGSLHLIDSAPWGDVTQRLRQGLITPPPLSKYTSAASREANAVIVDPERLSVSFSQCDVLALGKEALADRVVGGDGTGGTGKNSPVLITLLFTLNELFTSAGIGKTTAFLLDLTSVIPPESLLLVVDSPGSYSETAVGKGSRRYPMQWLLDKILLSTGKDESPVGDRRWTKLESHDSVWFRLSESLSYPIPLEDMRYQMHLYRVDDVCAAAD